MRKDNTIAYSGKFYQIQEKLRATKVTLEQRLNGSLHITADGKSLKYKEIARRPKKEVEARRPPRQRKTCVPAQDHPWRQFKRLKHRPRKEGAFVLTE